MPFSMPIFPQNVLQTLKPDHPRLLASQNTWKKIKETARRDALLRDYLNQSEREARAILSAPPVVYQKEGRRLLSVSRRALRRVLLLSLHYHLTGEAIFAARCEAELLAVCAFSDWNPSHFLDVGEMALAVALGYDWCYHFLPPSSRKTIEAALTQKALSHGLANEGWQTSANNWNGVCWGGLTLAALAIADIGPDTQKTASQIVEKAVQNNPRCLTAYAPDGVYPEGAMYWGYGTTFEAVLIAGLRSALGTAFGLENAPGFMESGDALLQQLGPTGTFFNFADNVETPELDAGMWWFAHTLNRPDLLVYDRARMRKAIASPRPPDPMSQSGRLLPLAALWWTTQDNKAKTPAVSYYGRGPNPVVSFRSTWDDPNALFLAAKGGSPSVSHAHMDGGSFVFEANGVRWACDLGMQDYLSLESKGIGLWDGSQTGQRWDVFRVGPLPHNTLTINGQKHTVTGTARFTHFGKAEKEAGAIVDLSPLFAGLAQSVRRRWAFRAGRDVLIRDEIAGLQTGGVVRWAMLTRAEVTVSPSGSEATLTQNGKTLRVVLQASVPAKWEVTPAGGPNPYDAPNPGARLLQAHCLAPASGCVDISVALIPTQTSDTKPETDAPWTRALGDWPLPKAAA